MTGLQGTEAPGICVVAWGAAPERKPLSATVGARGTQALRADASPDSGKLHVQSCGEFTSHSGEGESVILFLIH